MRFCSFVTCLLLLHMLVIAHGGRRDLKSISAISESSTHNNNNTGNAINKSSDKVSYPKKVTSLKKRPTKTSAASTTTTVTNTPTGKAKKLADVTAAFKDLPADDFEFIKELDNQFKLHGEKIKIKVEHDNSTTSKNAKRTIEGELGYGYQHNGYEYARPKFMFYPYSQQDIPVDAPGYYPKTAVSIEPSYSYQLPTQSYHEEQPQLDLPHPQPHDDPHLQQQQQQQQLQQGYDSPLIVLRIPGPAKYAAHLQTLLQQYLEIRATQYLSILEEAELRQHKQVQGPAYEQQHVEAPVPYDQAPVDYEQPPPPQHQQQEVPHQADVPNYQPEVMYAHQMAPTPPPIQYPDIDEVYHTYKSRHPNFAQQTPQAHLQQGAAGGNYYQGDVGYQQDGIPQYYYVPQQPEHQQGGHQQFYLVTMAADPGYAGPSHAQSQPIYVPEEEQQGHGEHAYAQQQEQQQQQVESHISENNPRKTHTKVVFTHGGAESGQGGEQYTPMYPLPSIRPYERHAPTSMPLYHQDYQQLHNHDGVGDYDQHGGAPLSAEASQQQTVTITQRPYNYHAHAAKAPTRARRGRKRGARIATPTARSTSTTQTNAAAQGEVQQEHKTDHQLQKIREFVRDNLGAQTGDSVEFKTTRVVKA